MDIEKSVTKMGMNKLIPQYWLVNQGITLDEIEVLVREGILKLVKENGRFTKYDNRLIY